MDNNPVCKVDYQNNIRWFVGDTLHREDGPAFIGKNGVKQWRFNGILHREDGPAIEYPDGDKKWFLNGKRHRLDGPAVIYKDGSSFWFFNGKRATLQITEWAEENCIDLENLSDVDIALIKIVWGDYGKGL